MRSVLLGGGARNPPVPFGAAFTVAGGLVVAVDRQDERAAFHGAQIHRTLLDRVGVVLQCPPRITSAEARQTRDRGRGSVVGEPAISGVFAVIGRGRLE